MNEFTHVDELLQGPDDLDDGHVRDELEAPVEVLEAVAREDVHRRIAEHAEQAQRRDRVRPKSDVLGALRGRTAADTGEVEGGQAVAEHGEAHAGGDAN